MTSELIELAIGRFYCDGEPEVRLRSKAGELIPFECLVGLTTIMGDGENAVGLVHTIFATSLGREEAATKAKSNIAARVSAAGGTVIAQYAEDINSLPEDVSRHVVVTMLRDAKQYLP
jgi:hypothetical protein